MPEGIGLRDVGIKHHVAKPGECVYSPVRARASPSPRITWGPPMPEDELPLASYVAVVLAGGEARRMGRNKLLMEISARPMIRHVVETIRGVVGRVIVVTGYQSERIAEALERLSVDLVTADPAHGAGAAIAAAFARARSFSGHAECEGILLCVGDQPRLTEREIVGLIEAYRKSDRRRAMVPVSGTQRGYPVVVPPDFDLAAVDLSDDDVIARHPERVVIFATRNPVYGSSLDTFEDYRAFFAI
jgi:CTP:molybdopterin cytidylyltransferase MocA